MPARVLIVDDDPGCVALEAQVVQGAGATVVGTAETGAQAIELALALTPTAVLLDVNLPDADGVQVAATLARQPSPPRVVLVSADLDAVSPDAVVSSGAVAFVPKADLVTTDLARLLGG